MLDCALVLILVFATPKPNSFAPLFIVERTTNANVVHYDARLTSDGEIDSRSPIVVYWTIGSAAGRREDLSLLERRLAWGFKVRQEPSGRYTMTIVAQKQIEVHVYRKDGVVRAETSISGSRAYLKKIFVNIEGPILFPKVNYLDLFGSEIEAGTELRQRITPVN
jgi:uncharacterized protein DUF4833